MPSVFSRTCRGSDNLPAQDAKLYPSPCLWLYLHRLHHDPRWYPEPEQFRPERWLENRAQRSFTYAPFGIGPRVCIGQHFAMAETVLGLVMMLQFRSGLKIRCRSRGPTYA
jgi:hypothetical protein